MPVDGTEGNPPGFRRHPDGAFEAAVGLPVSGRWHSSCELRDLR